MRFVACIADGLLLSSLLRIEVLSSDKSEMRLKRVGRGCIKLGLMKDAGAGEGGRSLIISVLLGFIWFYLAVVFLPVWFSYKTLVSVGRIGRSVGVSSPL